MPQISPQLAALQNEVRRLARPHLKAAAIGGEQDMPFEQAFSNLAHAYLKDKAPSLLDYEVGFQLVDRNQESTKAIGVFGFINGELKGHELLYIKNEDMFVPMKENWLNYILNRKPSVLGSGVGRNLRDIGVMPPHLYQLSRSPNKFAAAVDRYSPWVKEALPDLAYFATTNPAKDEKYKNLTDLPTFLKKEGKAVVRSLILGFKQMPKLATVFDQFHGLKVIDEALAEICEREKAAQSTSVIKSNKSAKCVNTPRGPRCFKGPQKTAPSKSVIAPPEEKPTETNTEPGDIVKTSAHGDPFDPAVTAVLEHKLKIITYDEVLQHGTGLENLNDKEREKLVKDKVLIKDDRPGAAVAYELQSPVRLQNPMETGLYDVLVKANKFEKCLIVFAPYSQRGRKDFVTLVRTSDGSDDKGRAWLNIHPSHIWIGKQYTNEEFQDWWKKLPNATSFSTSGNGLCLLIGNTGEGSLPFRVEKEISSDGGRKIYDVWFKNYAEKERADHLPPIDTRLMHYRGAYSEDNGSRIQLTGKRGARLRSTGGDLYVPDDYRKLVLRPDKDDDSDFGCCSCDAHSKPSPISPGNQFDIDLLLGTKTAAVKIFSTGTEMIINDKRMQKLAALIHLIRDWGLREKQARILLNRAEREKVTRFRVKKSTQTYDLQQTGPTAPPIPETPTGYDVMTGGNVPTQNLGEWNVKIPEMSAGLTDRMIYHPIGPDQPYQKTWPSGSSLSPSGSTGSSKQADSAAPDQGAQQAAMQAAGTGQKEVFDTAMIGSLLKAVRDDSMVDRYMPDLMKGLDRLGRILFLFYWHGEKFQDRYGKGEMIELEDAIRNSFEFLGDLVLFLKQRGVDTPEIQSHMAVDLGEVSD